jgi:hypothetical protein
MVIQQCKNNIIAVMVGILIHRPFSPTQNYNHIKQPPIFRVCVHNNTVIPNWIKKKDKKKTHTVLDLDKESPLGFCTSEDPPNPHSH